MEPAYCGLHGYDTVLCLVGGSQCFERKCSLQLQVRIRRQLVAPKSSLPLSRLYGVIIHLQTPSVTQKIERRILNDISQ
jgi:hypothetical protein